MTGYAGAAREGSAGAALPLVWLLRVPLALPALALLVGAVRWQTRPTTPAGPRRAR